MFSVHSVCYKVISNSHNLQTTKKTKQNHGKTKTQLSIYRNLRQTIKKEQHRNPHTQRHPTCLRNPQPIQRRPFTNTTHSAQHLCRSCRTSPNNPHHPQPTTTLANPLRPIPPTNRPITPLNPPTSQRQRQTLFNPPRLYHRYAISKHLTHNHLHQIKNNKATLNIYNI